MSFNLLRGRGSAEFAALPAPLGSGERNVPLDGGKSSIREAEEEGSRGGSFYPAPPFFLVFANLVAKHAFEGHSWEAKLIRLRSCR
jgi:hypothetical protein